MDTFRKPTKQELLSATGKGVPDLIAPHLRVLFCGINPGLYSAATAHHFARPGNRFWPALHGGGFTDTLLHPSQEKKLLDLGLGITNIVSRTTAAASELSRVELEKGSLELKEKVAQFEPCFLAILGITAYRTAFQKPDAVYGLQEEQLGSTRIWILPNPSGLNAHFKPADLARSFEELRKAEERFCTQ